MDNNAFLEQWLAAQKAYWESLGEGDTPPPPVEEALINAYSEALASRLDPAQQELGDTLKRQAELFRRLGEQLLKAQPQTGAAEAASDERKAEEDPLRTWFTTNAPAFVGLTSLAETLTQDKAGEPVGADAGIAQLLQSFHQAQLRYLSLHARILESASQALADKLKDPPFPDGPTALLRLWSRCYESHYQAQLATDTYQRAHGELINAWLCLQRHSRRARHHQVRLLGGVSQQEPESLLRSHQQLKRELRHLRNQRPPSPPADGAMRYAALEREVTQLRDQVAQLIAQLTDPSEPTH